jgi:hypothetical protein
VVEDCLRRQRDIKLIIVNRDGQPWSLHGGLALMPAYANNLLPWSVVAVHWQANRRRSS